jgi:hypothetical protein
MIILAKGSGLWWLDGAFYTLTSGRLGDLYITLHKSRPGLMSPAKSAQLHSLIKVIFRVDTIIDKRIKHYD